MKAMVWTRFGSPDVLQFQEVATPTPKDHEVLIRIRATTVTAADCELRALNAPLALRLPLGIYLGRIRPRPVILGQELAGDIAAVGPAVTRFKKGDQVFGWSGLHLGTYAEYTCLPESGILTSKPSDMTYEQVAPLSVGGLDALYLLKKAGIQPGQRVLINGAGGSIGSFAVQLARYFGADVTGVDSTGKLDMLRAIGADQVIDYTRDDFTRSGQTYDVIFDVIGKSPFSRSVRLLTPHGYYLIANPRLAQRVRGRGLARSSHRRVIFWAGRSRSEYMADFAFLKELMASGKLQSVIDRCYPLEQLAEAHRYVDSGHKKGNVVITVQPNSEPGPG
jgi:NADPH:quinone reductase-like Zn-dependent oxidoreductase